MSLDDDDDDAVGYGKPPKATRFKKGQSGNPKGRPKGAKSLHACLDRELESKVTVREGARTVTITKKEALAKRFVADALKGNVKATILLTKLEADRYAKLEDEVELGAASAHPEPVDYDILREFFASKMADTSIESDQGDQDG